MRFTLTSTVTWGIMLWATAIWAVLSPALPAWADPNAAEQKAIDHLIDYVGKSTVTFLRNGEKYDPAKAADHIRSKYNWTKGRITTAEEFIEKDASRSSISGTEYQIVEADGKTKPVSEWLKAELARYRKEGAAH